MVLCLVEVNESPDEEVEASIVIVVEPNRAGRPPRSGDSCTFGHISEGAVAIITIENAASVLRDVEIGKAVRIVVTHRNAHPVATARDAGRLGDVRKCSVAVVVVECVSQRMGRSIKIALPAVDQIDVHPPVIVIVEKCAARPGRFGQIFFR